MVLVLDQGGAFEGAERILDGQFVKTQTRVQEPVRRLFRGYEGVGPHKAIRVLDGMDRVFQRQV